MRETCLVGFANSKGADQPSHTRSVISSFVIHLIKSIISTIATSEISVFWLAFVAEHACLKMSGRQVFLRRRPIIPNKKRNAPLRFSHLDLLLKRKC